MTAILKKRIGSIVFKHAPCLVVAIDRHFKIVDSNDAFKDAFGHKDGEHCFAVYKGQGEICDGCALTKVFEEGTTQVSQEQGVTREGKHIAYQVKAFPLKDDKGDVDLVLQMSLDTTRLLELEQGFKQAERLARVGLTAAGFAHTIKNLLAGLEGVIYVIDSGLEKKDQDRVLSGWTLVKGYLEQTTNLVKNLLSYARPKASRKEEVDPSELAADVVSLYKEKAGMANIELHSKVERQLAPIWVDREAMHASLTNLISNSVDACMWDPDTDKDHKISISVQGSAKNCVVFEVADNGMGISEENQRKILSSFFTTKGTRGTGLGLLTTKNAVQSHGGSISFASTPGKGTTFRIELPVNCVQLPKQVGDKKEPI